MANPIPALRGSTQQALYPVTRTVGCLTRVNTFWNGSERRWVRRGPLYSFALPMHSLGAVDKAAWLAIFSGAKGQLNTDLQLTLGGTVYSDLTYVGNNLSVETVLPLLYNQQVSLRQVKPANPMTYAPPTFSGTYPSLAIGARAEYPFTQVSTFLTVVGDSELGQRFAFSWYGAGLANFPTGCLRNWGLRYPLVHDADLATLETHFLGCQGRYRDFDFTDPIDGVTYHHVRYASDSLVVQHLTANQNAVDITLHQTFGG